VGVFEVQQHRLHTAPLPAFVRLRNATRLSSYQWYQQGERGCAAAAAHQQGRLRALQRKLAGVARLVFIDAPHVLPLWVLKPLDDGHDDGAGAEQQAASTAVLPSRCSEGRLPNPKRCWLCSQPILDAQPQLRAMFEEAASPRWESAPTAVAVAEQYKAEQCGWDASWQVLRAALAHQGAVGVLGFSQGAAVAAVIAALAQQQQQKQQEQQQQQQEQQLNLKFVILASGFVSPTPEHESLLRAQAPLTLPSLHLFVADVGADRQIERQASEELMQLFAASSRTVVTHAAGGHLVPCDAESVARIRAFLLQHIV
jgi:hypothetical protein